ncbi:MAG TPA: hypothetical protein PLB35_04840 [Myxococcota bacterium]|nr:hypothetical protein [Myxococcota bacterium]HPV04589.1 hypothetical protein [Myxococcota bacterium]
MKMTAFPTVAACFLSACAIALAGCGAGGDDKDTGTDLGPEIGQPDTVDDDGPGDTAMDAADPETTGDEGSKPDLIMDAETVDPDDARDDAADAFDATPDGLPETLALEFTRPDEGDPVSQADIDAFTRKVMRFLRDVKYFDYVLYTTHGVDASTGKRDFQFWYNERMRKEGDLVTFYHPVNMTDGGHNLHIPMSKLLGNLMAAYMLTGDATAGLAVEKLCKGFSASMLGMVHDENDDLPHLMTRNVVMMAHEFTTHDGKRKAVDPSGWYSAYERWNCDRYQITENPYWGEVWVTNLRSKDDVPHILQMIPNLRYLVETAPAGATLDACTETLTLLEAFTKDIVDHDYRIRTKDFDGTLYEPGYTGDAETDQNQGDIGSFTYWRDFIPMAECNARRASMLIAYKKPGEESCGRGEPNDYDDIAFMNNGYNKRICQFFHLAHIANALVNHDNGEAALLLDGMAERIAEDWALAPNQDKIQVDDYTRNVALLAAQASVFGYPLTSAEVRLIHTYYGRTPDKIADWPYWDPWAETVPQGDLGAYRPPDCEGEGDAKLCWTRIEDMGALWEYCWSPLKNPTGRQWVNCDIVRDPESWDDDLPD